MNKIADHIQAIYRLILKLKMSNEALLDRDNPIVWNECYFVSRLSGRNTRRSSNGTYKSGSNQVLEEVVGLINEYTNS